VGTAGEEEEHDGCAFGSLLSELPRYVVGEVSRNAVMRLSRSGYGARVVVGV
jgi:hypothetical protein